MSSPVSRVAGIVLASGLSRRFGARNKLTEHVRGEPVVRRTVRVYVEVGLNPVLVVVGHEAAAVEAALAGLPVEVVQNPEYEQGQSRSLVAGIRALPAVEAAVIGVGDQPLLVPDVIASLIEAYRRTGALVAVPRFGGERGNPVLFDRKLFAELLEVQGDQGGRSVLRRYADRAVWVDIANGRAGADVDTPEDLVGLDGVPD